MMRFTGFTGLNMRIPAFIKSQKPGTGFTDSYLKSE